MRVGAGFGLEREHGKIKLRTVFVRRHMAARDKIHELVKQALIKDGWTITDDPFTIEFDANTRVFADLGAERLIAAQRDKEKIAVEIKTFGGYSPIHEMQSAMGQYLMYLSFLNRVEPERVLYLAISDTVYGHIFTRESFRFLVEQYTIKLIVVDIGNTEVVQWIN